jgi:eukaryotic-like serine/threonine-protein kinase
MTLAEGPGQRAHRRNGDMVRDKYRIDAFIATGSMATVYAATHRNGSRVALKILHRELARDPSMAERFKREGYFANAIGHPGVVRAIDDDVTEDGCAFIVMELLEGETLEERRTRLGGRIPLNEALDVADAMLDVLAAAHAHEVLHRDVKPENVFLTKNNVVKLLDFGVARFNDGKSSSDMTAVGMVLGTPAFMPPEQALGRREEVDARSDIWGVGATLFTALAGESVHPGGDAKTKLIATARKPARPIGEVAPDVPAAIASVIDRALSFEKLDRWGDANAMREALRWARTSGDLEDAATPMPAPVTRRGDKPELFEDPTARRPPIPLPDSLRMPNSGDDVFTSAPPVTKREAPPSMPAMEEPTFSLHNDPVFALRPSPPPKAPITERLPGAHAPPPAEKADDPGEIFRAALANAASATRAVVDDDDVTTQFLSKKDEDGPRGARTNTAIGLGPGAAPPNDATFAASPKAKQSVTTQPLGPVVHPSATPPGSASFPTVSAPAGAPPKFASYGPPQREIDGRPSLPPEQPGPLLATIVPDKPRRALRIAISIAVGVLAGVATYAIVVRLRTANASRPTAEVPTVTASVSASASASAIPMMSASAPPPPSPPVAVASSAPVAAASSSAPPVPHPPKKRRKPPKPAPVTSTTSTAAPPPPPPEPEPAPTSAPAPTPQDSLPRKEE